MARIKYSDIFAANHIRREFLDYFSNNGHSFLRSSSVKPFGDSSLEFVNAGMNQFKNVFLGLERIPCARVVNTQKCIRVGGKHNDLNSVGHDSYHHTFFEMLGNWSFNNYFKEEACRLAWTLITQKPFSLDPKRLYVTYFGGDKEINLDPDLETKEIWLNIGVQKERILPFGLKDNFWEMGMHGPCGPCTEIHYDHLGSQGRPHLVNGGLPDLTELWNLVFIQYNRLQDSSLVRLNKHFVDTGMGLERLVAILQGKTSNYDTDLFTPYFTVISKVSGCREYRGKFSDYDADGLDTAYRILADHSRMMTIAIADHVFPEESHGLRRVIRKALSTANKFLPGNGVRLISELCKVAGEMFYEIFPETLNNQNQIQHVIQDENELWNLNVSKLKSNWESLTQKCPGLDTLSDVQSPGLVAALSELGKWKMERGTEFPRELSIIMYDRYGLNPQVIEQFANIFGHTVNLNVLEKDIATLKKNNKLLIYSNKGSEISREAIEYAVNNIKPTDDSFKLNYTKNSQNEYFFNSVITKIEMMLVDNKIIENISLLKNGAAVSVLLAQTNMWATLKGDSDSGHIKLCHKGQPFAHVSVNNVINIQGYIFHIGTLHCDSKMNDVPVKELEGEVLVDVKRRLDLMRNTTAAHLLTIALKEKYVANVKSIIIAQDHFTTQYCLYGQLLTEEDVEHLEEATNKLINQDITITVSSKSTNDIVDTSDIIIPSFINSSMKEIQLANFDLKGGLREVTIGPNVLKSTDIKGMSLVKIEKKGRNREIVVSGVTGEYVTISQENASVLLDLLSSEVPNIELNLHKAKHIMNNCHLPCHLHGEINRKMDEFKLKLKKSGRSDKIKSLKDDIKKAEENGNKYFVMYVGKELKLEKLLDGSEKIPILLFGIVNKHLVARCFVPPNCNFSTREWISEVANMFGTEAILSRKKDSRLFTIKPLRIQSDEIPRVISEFEIAARTKAKNLLENSQ